jgi:Zn-dependent M16 (insulinase) family peptidase
LLVDDILLALNNINAMPVTDYSQFPWSTASQPDYMQAVTDPDGEAYVRSNLP